MTTFEMNQSRNFLDSRHNHNILIILSTLFPLASTPCQPNPCFNQGKCQETSPTTFVCDCTSTLYTGKLCDTGLIEIPSNLPQLVVNEESIDVMIYARPTAYLTITPRSSDDITFIPAVIRMEVPQTSASFKMLASRTGVFGVEFEIGGQNDFDFQQPSSVQARVFQNKTSLLFDMNVEDIIDTSVTLNLTEKLSLQSSCIKDGKSPAGFVAVNSKSSTTLPLSIVGLYKSTLDSFSSSGILDPNEEIDTYLKARIIKESSKCLQTRNNSTTFNQQVDYVIKNNFFQILTLKQITKSFPDWFELKKINSGPEYDTGNLMTKIVSKDELKKTKCFKPLVKDASLFPLLDSRFNMYHSNTPVSVKIMSNKIDFLNTNNICYFRDNTLDQTNILSDSPIKFITDPSPFHVISRLESRFISVSSKGESFMVDVQMKMKSFDGKIQMKSLLTLQDSLKVSDKVF